MIDNNPAKLDANVLSQVQALTAAILDAAGVKGEARLTGVGLQVEVAVKQFASAIVEQVRFELGRAS